MKKIMIVDDFEQNARLIQKILEREERMSMTVAFSGEEAIELWKSEGGFDLILMDVMMPVMTGFETSEQIRSLEGGKEVPIILVTAAEEDYYQEEVERAGINDYIMKPVVRKTLVEKVHQWTGR